MSAENSSRPDAFAAASPRISGLPISSG